MSNLSESVSNPVVDQETEGPPTKRMRESEGEKNRILNVAVAGCSHGEMDKIYSTLAVMERNRGIKFDLLICCGDYQAIRNSSDLQTMHVHPKYRQLGTFHQYYSGERIAPIFTIFVGGNHESSGFMAELPYGGWVAPNIYYMGFASVVKFGGLRIAGISGIYKPQDYTKGHYERPPFEDQSSLISMYHVRNLEIFRLKQMARREKDERSNALDIVVSHDWPAGITDFGNTEQLLRFKPHFTDDIKNNRLGNPATMDLLHQLAPRYWFSAHLHCRYQAEVEHDPIEEDNQQRTPESTKFLALDKPLPKRRFLEALQIPVPDDVDEINFEYDPIWLTILKNTNHLTEITSRTVYMPSKTGSERWDFRPKEDEIEEVKKLFNNDFRIPDNFRQTAPPFTPGESVYEPCLYYLNPQTTEFCEKLGIKNLNEMLFNSTQKFNGTPFYELVGKSTVENSEEIDLGDDDEEADFVLDDAGRRDVSEGN